MDPDLQAPRRARSRDLGCGHPSVRFLPEHGQGNCQLRDAAKSTGAAPPVYSDLDHIVLDILGADSTASNGIGEGNDQEDLNFQAEGEEELTGFDTTTESEFRVPISPRVPVFARKSAPPHASRTSSPIPEEGDNHSNGQDTQDNTQQPRSSGPSSNVKKRKIGPRKGQTFSELLRCLLQAVTS